MCAGLGHARRAHRKHPLRADPNFARCGIEADHIERFGLAADFEALALAHGEVDDALVCTQRLAGSGVDDRAGSRAFGAHLGDDLGVIAIGHEADVLRIRLGRVPQPRRLGQFAHLRLGQASQREAQVLDKLNAANKGPLNAQHINVLFKEIMSACRSLEREVHVAFLGPLGTYSEQAVWSFFGHCVQAEPVETIEEAFRQLQAQQVDFAVVPVENSTEGSIARTLDALVESSALVCGEVQLAIHHQLLCQTGSLDGIEKICAHPQALAQCRGWLSQYAPHIQQETVASNGVAAQMASENAKVAAIAGQAARERYGLKAFQEHIEALEKLISGQ